MPFVFVHGVNNRLNADYAREEQVRSAFLKEYVAPAVGINPKHRVFAPYWGGDGVKFRRNLEVIPKGKGLETFGPVGELPPSLGIAIADKVVSDADTVDSVIKQQPAVAIDLLFDSAIQQAKTEDDLQALARAYRLAEAQLAASGADWLADTGADTLANDVFKAVTEKGPGEVFGGPKPWTLLKEGAKRLTLFGPDKLSHLAVGATRRPLTEKVATFIGDAFQYLAERGDSTKPGTIASAVLKELTEASALAKASGEPLIAISHSFGGEIVYDLLTHYAEGTDLQVDAWVTVGSQVGLFEEMSLLWTSPGRTNPAAPSEAVVAPARARRWINIVDTNDVLGFLVLPVFTGATPGQVNDFKYDTGYPVTGAHSGYFKWPSFYKRLAHRLR